MSDDVPTEDTLPSEPSSGVSRGAPVGYRIGELLGRGGMGEVVLATDERIGRDVALKRMRADADGNRFLREAKIQARLDHPAIVPVHEVGTDRDGRPYFTMKRLTGTTLAARLADSSLGEHRLLRAFVDVCNAIASAHERGIVHRDLKPSNIMLGNHGAVYVIDWGVARFVDETIDEPTGPTSTDDGDTATGAMLGTPGYMAPEQARLQPAGPPADVYALGAILFEIIARKPLHPRGLGAVISTLDTPARAPGGAPELDEVCLAALALDPAARPTASEIAERVERFLEGDRDVARRRELAAELLVRARAAHGAGDRAAAMNAAGRALALDPESQAAALVTALMFERPAEMPAEVDARMGVLDRELERQQFRVAAIAFLVFFAFLPFLVIAGVTNWPTTAAIYGGVGVFALMCWRAGRTTEPPSVFPLVGNALIAAACTRFVGPFIVVPGLVCAMAMAMSSYPRMLRHPVLPPLVLAAALLVPIGLEQLGWLDSTWSIRGEEIVSRSTVIHLPPVMATFLVVGSTLATMVTIAMFARTMARARRAAQESVELQAWHLRKLLPPTW